MASNLICVDEKKLRKILKDRGLQLDIVSQEIGFDKSFMAKSLSRGSFSRNALRGLDMRYGIHYDDIKPEEPKQEPEQMELQVQQDQQENVKIEPIDYQKLFAVVYQAFKKALSERGDI